MTQADVATIRLGLAMASNEELLAELLRRELLAPCSASMFVDGRAIRELEHRDDNVQNYLELRALEVLSRGLATARLTDRVHVFTREPAQGDFAPGSEYVKVEMLAVRLNPGEPT